jgi:hypothetical protein
VPASGGPARVYRVGAGGASVDLYSGKGVLLVAPKIKAPGNKGMRGKRGAIKGWSKASRHRLRMWMLTHAPANPDALLLKCTYTVPGPSLSPADARRLWDIFAKNQCVRCGVGAIWRLEVQERGAAHWHCLMVFPPSAISRFFPGVTLTDREQMAVLAPLIAQMMWHNALKASGPEDFNPPFVQEGGKGKKRWRKEYKHVENRFCFVGAARHSAKVEGMPESKQLSWLRYLQDHTSKAKQGQIAQGFGRHWGVVGKKQFREVLPDNRITLTDAQYWAFCRMYRRMIAGLIKAPLAPFGRKVASLWSVGIAGCTPRFSSPETVARMCDCARQIRE